MLKINKLKLFKTTHNGSKNNSIPNGENPKRKIYKLKFNKKIFSLILIAAVILSLSFVALQNVQNPKSNGIPTTPVSTDQPQKSSTKFNILTSTYNDVPYDLYCPVNYSGSVVVLAGGILGEKHYLVGWAENLAERGYAALAFSTQSEDLDHVSQYVDNCKINLETMVSFVFNDSAFPIEVNPDAVSLIGMSGGGATVLAYNDTRINSVVSVCPYYIDNISTSNSGPVLIITGETDNIAPHESNGALYYDELNPTKMIVKQADVGHDINPEGWKYAYAWLDYYVAEDPDAYATLQNVESDLSILESSSDLSEP
jgi:dienelactone hydrolase